ncbi:hypothetical protein Tco_0971684 [Tanacetum coccineum]
MGFRVGLSTFRHSVAAERKHGSFCNVEWEILWLGDGGEDSEEMKNKREELHNSTFPARAEEDADISLLIGLADGVFTFILEVALKAPPEAFVHLSGETFSAFAGDKEWQHQTFSI